MPMHWKKETKRQLNVRRSIPDRDCYCVVGNWEVSLCKFRMPVIRPKMTHSIRCMRDPTRGGFSSAVNEIAAQSRVRIPIATPARALACDCFREEALLTQLPHAPPLATSRAATPVEPQEKHRSRTS